MYGMHLVQISLPGADVGESNAVGGLYPAITFVICVFCLGEHITAYKVMGVFFAILSGLCFLK